MCCSSHWAHWHTSAQTHIPIPSPFSNSPAQRQLRELSEAAVNGGGDGSGLSPRGASAEVGSFVVCTHWEQITRFCGRSHIGPHIFPLLKSKEIHKFYSKKNQKKMSAVMSMSRAPSQQSQYGRRDPMLEGDKLGIHTIPKGDCPQCGQAVIGPVVIALGRMWHPEHFCCAHCGDSIGHRNFFERQGKAYCETDFHGIFSECTF